MINIENVIKNIFKEKGVEVDKIEDNKVYFLDRYYQYEIKELEDLIIFKNKFGATMDEKYISSFINDFSFTINK